MNPAIVAIIPLTKPTSSLSKMIRATPRVERLVPTFIIIHRTVKPGRSGQSRFVWNKVLALCLARLDNKQNLLWYNEAAYWLTLWKSSEDFGFLKQCHSQVLQQKLKDLEKAFRDGFDKNQPLKRMPVFKLVVNKSLLLCRSEHYKKILSH